MSTLSNETEITLYWMPGCSSCLRMKEFVENTGRPFTAINVDEDPEAAQKISDLGIRIPAICLGDQCINGVSLANVAELIGEPYSPPVMLSPAELRSRYHTIIDALLRLTAQITPELGSYKLPHRDRDLLNLSGHAGCAMRYFLGKYESEEFTGFFDDMEPGYRTADELIAYIEETRSQFEIWWEQDGQYDPLDTVITVYWGPRTLHEALEREVWHTAQHTRQIALMLEQQGVTPDGALTAEELDGLPLPKRVFD